MSWSLDAAIPVLRAIEGALIPLGYHSALGGSVLHVGTSEKDLDVFIYPHNTSAEAATPETLLNAICLAIDGGFAFGACNADYQERDGKDVWWSYGKNNQRIDFFFL